MKLQKVNRRAFNHLLSLIPFVGVLGFKQTPTVQPQQEFRQEEGRRYYKVFVQKESGFEQTRMRNLKILDLFVLVDNGKVIDSSLYRATSNPYWNEKERFWGISAEFVQNVAEDFEPYPRTAANDEQLKYALIRSEDGQSYKEDWYQCSAPDYQELMELGGSISGEWRCNGTAVKKFKQAKLGPNEPYADLWKVQIRWTHV